MGGQGMQAAKEFSCATNLGSAGAPSATLKISFPLSKTAYPILRTLINFINSRSSHKPEQRVRL